MTIDALGQVIANRIECEKVGRGLSAVCDNGSDGDHSMEWMVLMIGGGGGEKQADWANEIQSVMEKGKDEEEEEGKRGSGEEEQQGMRRDPTNG